MTKYEEAKVQVKAQEIADKVLNMSQPEYARFVKKLQAEINMLNAGIEETQGKLIELQMTPNKKLAEGDANLITLMGAATGFIGSIVACANQLSPIGFVDLLIMGSSAIGATGMGVIAGALAASLIEYDPVQRGVKKAKIYFNKRKLAGMKDSLYEKDAIMDEICEGAVEASMGYND
jgi:hypothetical protein